MFLFSLAWNVFSIFSSGCSFLVTAYYLNGSSLRKIYKYLKKLETFETQDKFITVPSISSSYKMKVKKFNENQFSYIHTSYMPDHNVNHISYCICSQKGKPLPYKTITQAMISLQRTKQTMKSMVDCS